MAGTDARAASAPLPEEPRASRLDLHRKLFCNQLGAGSRTWLLTLSPHEQPQQQLGPQLWLEEEEEVEERGTGMSIVCGLTLSLARSVSGWL